MQAVSRQFHPFNAASKAFAAWARRIGWGTVAPGWEAKAALCEQCPMRVVRCGVSYCGKPYLQKIQRDPTVDGCGCPCHEKAKTPGEHCPLDSHYQAATRAPSACTCKWCSAR